MVHEMVTRMFEMALRAEVEPPPPLPLGLMLTLGGIGVLSAAVVVGGSVLMRRKRLRELGERGETTAEDPLT